MSIDDLKILEHKVARELSKVRNGIIDESFSSYEPEEIEKLLVAKHLEIQNTITAKKLRSNN